MSEKAPIEYGPDPDDVDDENGLEASTVQKVFVPFYAVLVVVFIITLSIPLVFIYTVAWMGYDAREQTRITEQELQRDILKP